MGERKNFLTTPAGIATLIVTLTCCACLATAAGGAALFWVVEQIQLPNIDEPPAYEQDSVSPSRSNPLAPRPRHTAGAGAA